MFNAENGMASKTKKSSAEIEDNMEETEDAEEESSCVICEAEEDGEEPVADVLDQKLTTLMDLPGIGEKTAEKLKESGYVDMLAIAAASAMELSAVAEIGEGTANKIILAARESLDLGFMTAEALMKKRESVGRITTGSKILDELYGGGIQTQAITESYGKFGSGKSQLGFQLAVNCLLPKDQGGLDGEVAFIDTENTFRPERLIQMAEKVGLSKEDVLKRVLVARAFNSDHQMLLVDQIEKLVNQGQNIRLIIVDSLMAHFRSEYLGRGTLAPRQQKLNRHLHRLQRLADVHNLAVYITNQVMSKPDALWGPGIVPTGGNILGHAATYRVYLRKGRGMQRIARMIDSPDLPDGEAVFKISGEGITD